MFLAGWPNKVRAGDPSNEPARLEHGEIRPALGASWDLERERRVALALRFAKASRRPVYWLTSGEKS